jgi:hypothetical protein
MSTYLVDRLINSLNSEGINYCHWKSNIDLAQATSGEMDLDFLIDRESVQPVYSILSKLGFKPAMIRRGTNTVYPPDMTTAIGLPRTSVSRVGVMKISFK